MDIILIIPILLPIVAGILYGVLPASRKIKNILLTVCLAVNGVIATTAAAQGGRLSLMSFGGKLSLELAPDSMSVLFAVLISAVWLISTVYAFGYMTHEGGEDRFFAFSTVTLGMMLGLALSANPLTMYLFFELTTLCSVPLVLHSLKKESVRAALKYLFYSVAGAFIALFGIFVIYSFSDDATFTPGGTLSSVTGNAPTVVLVAALLSVIGFGTKAGLYPMHGWLPTAHPAAPAPASALLSGMIAKAGIIAVIRVVYFSFGAPLLSGTWMQYVWLTLACLTVFMGSMMAYREKILKKRLAYSTVSNLSYIMIGLALLSPNGLEGALLHMIAHAFAKGALFLAAGAFIYKFGYTTVSELKGIGKKMPVTLWCFALSALSLIGIPPLAGFISKWYLASAALSSPVGLFSMLAPITLLLSALLTAGYLLPVVIDGFFPGKELSFDGKVSEVSPVMLIGMIALTAVTVLSAFFASPLCSFLADMAAGAL